MGEEIKAFHPTGERVLVRMKEEESVSDGGIFIPDMARRTSVEGTVIAIGPNVEEVGHGDNVLVPRICGIKVDLGDELKYKLFLESEIIGIVIVDE